MSKQKGRQANLGLFEPSVRLTARLKSVNFIF
jgi:hypothetical protein